MLKSLLNAFTGTQNVPVKTTRKISNELYQGELPIIFDW